MKRLHQKGSTLVVALLVLVAASILGGAAMAILAARMQTTELAAEAAQRRIIIDNGRELAGQFLYATVLPGGLVTSGGSFADIPYIDPGGVTNAFGTTVWATVALSNSTAGTSIPLGPTNVSSANRLTFMTTAINHFSPMGASANDLVTNQTQGVYTMDFPYVITTDNRTVTNTFRLRSRSPVFTSVPSGNGVFLPSPQGRTDIGYFPATAMNSGGFSGGYAVTDLVANSTVLNTIDPVDAAVSLATATNTALKNRSYLTSLVYRAASQPGAIASPYETTNLTTNTNNWMYTAATNSGTNTIDLRLVANTSPWQPIYINDGRTAALTIIGSTDFALNPVGLVMIQNSTAATNLAAITLSGPNFRRLVIAVKKPAASPNLSVQFSNFEFSNLGAFWLMTATFEANVTLTNASQVTVVGGIRSTSSPAASGSISYSAESPNKSTLDQITDRAGWVESYAQ